MGPPPMSHHGYGTVKPRPALQQGPPPPLGMSGQSQHPCVWVGASRILVGLVVVVQVSSAYYTPQCHTKNTRASPNHTTPEQCVRSIIGQNVHAALVIASGEESVPTHKSRFVPHQLTRRPAIRPASHKLQLQASARACFRRTDAERSCSTRPPRRHAHTHTHSGTGPNVHARTPTQSSPALPCPMTSGQGKRQRARRVCACV